MIQEDVLDTLNMVLGCVKKFLQRFDEHFHAQKSVFPEISNPTWRLKFSKIQLFELLNRVGNFRKKPTFERELVKSL